MDINATRGSILDIARMHLGAILDVAGMKQGTILAVHSCLSQGAALVWTNSVCQTLCKEKTKLDNFMTRLGLRNY